MPPIRMGLDHYPMSLFESLPRLYVEIRDSFREVYGLELSADDVPEVISFGSWIGGDRDGNPFVTVESTREALERARNTVLAHYIAELERISEQLSSSCKQVSVSPEFQEQHDNYSRHLGEEPARLAPLLVIECKAACFDAYLRGIQRTRLIHYEAIRVQRTCRYPDLGEQPCQAKKCGRRKGSQVLLGQ